MRTNLLWLVALGAFAVGCSSEHVQLSHPDASGAQGVLDPLTLAEGDLSVVEAKVYVDDEEEEDACPSVRSSDRSVADVQAVKDDCRIFVILAMRPGEAKLTFKPDGDATTIDVVVTPR